MNMEHGYSKHHDVKHGKNVQNTSFHIEDRALLDLHLN